MALGENSTSGPGLVARDARGAAGLCVAGVALGDIHLIPPLFHVAGVAQSHIHDAAGLCVAGVALGDIHLNFTWQAWHNLTSTVVSTQT